MKHSESRSLRRQHSASLDMDSLSTPEHWLLVILRLWVAELFEPGRWHASWTNGFKAAGLGDNSIEAFTTLANYLLTHSHTKLAFHSPECPCISRDEVLFLQVICLLQLNQPDKARKILDYWLPQAVVRLALPPATHLANALQACGMPVPLRPRRQTSESWEARQGVHAFHGRVEYLH